MVLSSTIKMEKTLLQLIESNDVSKLQELTKKAKKSEITKALDASLLKNSCRSYQILRALFQGLQVNFLNEEQCDGKLFIIYEHVITIMKDNSEQLSDKQTNEIIDLLTVQCDGLSSNNLVDLCNMNLKFIKDGSNLSGKWLQLFPKLLLTISLRDQVTDTSLYPIAEITGAEFKDSIISRLCTYSWDPDAVVHILSILKEIPLASEHLENVFSQVFKLLKELQYQEIPPVAYQLLLLSLKGYRATVINGLTAYFDMEDERIQEKNENCQRSDSEVVENQNSSDNLRHAEGTVILHFTFAAKQYQELTKEFIKILKAYQHAPGKILSPFFFSLSLSLIRVSRISEQVIDLLKNAVLKCYKEQIVCNQSKWIKQLISQELNVNKIATETIANSKFGWDYVVQGLVQFGFHLMDTCGPKAAFGRLTESNIKQHSDSAMSKACNLGADILSNTFIAHESVRSEILEQLLNRTVVHASSPITQYVDLLSATIHASPQLLLDSISKIREVLDYLSFLPSISARQLLVSFLPLLKISMPLKDSLMLVLRKALFSRQLDSRKVAVTGFLLFLKHFKVLGSLPSLSSQPTQSSGSSLSFLTQVTADVHYDTSYNSQANEAFCLEVLGTLRRCLQQQNEIRHILYAGLYEVILKNKMITSHVLHLLYHQLNLYYEENESAQPPLYLDKCIDEKSDVAELREPISHLIVMLQLCLNALMEKNQTDDEVCEEELEISKKSENVLTSLCKRITTAELEDFELDKSSEYSSATSSGLKNVKKAQLLLGVYETLIEFSFTHGNFSVDSCQTVIDLFNNRGELSKVLDEKCTGAAKKKDGSVSSSSIKKPGQSKKSKTLKTQCLFSFNFLGSIIQALFNDEFPSHNESLHLLRSNLNFMSYIISATTTKINQLKDSRLSDIAYEKLFQTLCTLGRSLLKYFSVKNDSEDRNGNIVSLTIDAFSKILNVVDTKYKDSMIIFITSLENHDDSNTKKLNNTSDEKQILKVIKNFQEIINTILSGDCVENLKNIQHLTNIISTFEKYLSEKSAEEVSNWIKELCKEYEVANSSGTKSLLTFLLNTCRRCNAVSTIVRDMFCDIHSKMNDIIEDVQVESCDYYKLITPSFVTLTIPLIITHIETLLEDIDWLVNRMKAQLSTGLSTEDQRKKEEISVCVQLGTLITGLCELVQTALPRGPCFDAVFKCLTHFYNCMTNFIKYNVSKVSSNNKYLCAKLEKLVKLSGTNLTPRVYSMINYVQSSDMPKEATRKSKDSAAQKAKVIKESRGIPSLIFSIEQNERYLIQLSKKAKINLMANVKLSTARDFRINKQTLISNKDDNPDVIEDDDESNAASRSVVVDDVQVENPADNEVSSQAEETIDNTSNRSITLGAPAGQENSFSKPKKNSSFYKSLRASKKSVLEDKSNEDIVSDGAVCEAEPPSTKETRPTKIRKLQHDDLSVKASVSLLKGNKRTLGMRR